jgi:hypothetical protein
MATSVLRRMRTWFGRAIVENVRVSVLLYF